LCEDVFYEFCPAAALADHCGGAPSAGIRSLARGVGTTGLQPWLTKYFTIFIEKLLLLAV
jgi:hypothetical protein